MKLTMLRRGVLAGVLAAAVILAGWPAPAAGASNLRFADSAFSSVWTRTDSPVAEGTAARSWYWGPAPGMIVREPYADAPGGTRLVQYFDKSRMEINNPNGDKSSKFFVTNGLLSIELISGKMAVGNNRYETRTPAAIPLASDGDDPVGPTYASFLGVSNTPAGDHPAPDRTGQNVTATLNRAGTVGNDPARALEATKIAHFEPATKHNVPKVFWQFLNATGPVSVDNRTITAPLSDPWTFTTGLPISEAYWAQVRIAGKPETVLIQAYERRVLTYIPSYDPAWQVQMNNAGQQYYAWRYGDTAVRLSSALARMDSAASYHASSTMDLVVGGAQPLRFAVQEADYAAPNKVYIKQTAAGLSGPQTSEVITIGTAGYVKAPDTGNVWVWINPNDVGADPAALNIASLLGVIQYASNLQVVGDETVDGVATTHYKMTLDPKGIPTVNGLTWSAATGDVWIAKATGLFQRVTANMTLGPGAIRQGAVLVTVAFRDYGKPVTITAPIP
jgi:hypothetical protein